MKRYLFISFFMLSLCNGYAQAGKGVFGVVVRQLYRKSSPKEIRVPKIGEGNDSIKNKIIEEARKCVEFEDSMYAIAKTDTFGIYCRARNREIKAQGMTLMWRQVQQFETCLKYLVKNLVNDKEKFYDVYLEKGIPLQTVQSLYRMVTLYRPFIRSGIEQKPPISIARKEQRTLFASWKRCNN